MLEKKASKGAFFVYGAQQKLRLLINQHNFKNLRIAC